MTILLFSCSEEKTADNGMVSSENTLFQMISSEVSGIDFINEVSDGEKFNVLTYRNFYNGGGVGIGDVNNDGLVDVFFTANMAKNKLYLNKGNFKFEDISESAGIEGTRAWSTGVSLADVNGDGLIDIYVCNSGDVEGDNKSNELFINNGDLTFTESADKYNLADNGFSTHASFFDFDQDGDLDCYILNNSFKDPDKVDMNPKGRLDDDNEGGDKLMRNDGGAFVDVTRDAGIYNSKIGFGLGVSVSDLNGDNLPDIYVSNDFFERDYLYLNNGDGTFEEELTSRLDICSISSMGADINDINNDGNPDIFTTDMLAGDNYRLKAYTLFDSYNLRDLKYRESFHYQILQNTLQLNDGNANFQEVANLCEVAATDWSWGALIFDFDNDGNKDIYVANGIYKDLMFLDFTDFVNDKEEVKKVVTEKGKFDWRDFADYIPSNPLSNFAYVNKSQNQNIPSFKNEAKRLGLATPSFSNGAAYGDLDNDGDLDLIVNNVNMDAFVYKNNASNNYLKVALKGSEENIRGIGSKLEITTKNGIQTQQVYSARGFESSVDPSIVFGLGKIDTVTSLKIVWSNGKSQTLENIEANQTITLDIRNANNDFELAEIELIEPVFVDRTSNIFSKIPEHKENRYNDFDHERLAIKMNSTEGPTIIKGDLNGDNLEDIFIGGAAGDEDEVYYQKNGKFIKAVQWNSLVKEDIEFETTAAAIFDADGDGDKDLLVGSGGNEYMKGVENFLLRYYENVGGGKFKKSVQKTPPAAGNVSCIVPGDIDGDGDMDVFIGCKIVPGNYGLPPRSFLMRNDGNGVWQDVSTENIANAGMVTDAVFSDIDGDKDNDLILVGDWMPVMVFENNNGVLNFSQKQTKRPYSGWWNRIEKADLDGDGDDDFVIGNWGLNSKFKASDQKKLSMFTKDFDGNKKSEFIINWYAPFDDSPYPFANRMNMMSQLPLLKKKNLTYDAYAKQTYETLLDEKQRAGAFESKINILESIILWNNGNKGFSVSILPKEAQVTPVYGIAIDDFDGDEIKDIWLGGNFHNLEPQAGRSDSGKGVLLKGNKDKSYNYIDWDRSGIKIEGEVRAAITTKVGNKNMLIVARNNDSTRAYTYK